MDYMESSMDKQIEGAASENEALRQEVARLKEAINNCLDWANGRQSEWGDRAETAFEFLERAI